MIRSRQRGRIESGPIAGGCKPWKTIAMIQEIRGAVEQDNDRAFAPLFSAAIEPAVSRIVLHNVTGSRRGKGKIFPAMEFELGGLAFERDKIRPIQEFNGLVQF